MMRRSVALFSLFAISLASLPGCMVDPVITGLGKVVAGNIKGLTVEEIVSMADAVGAPVTEDDAAIVSDFFVDNDIQTIDDLQQTIENPPEGIDVPDEVQSFVDSGALD